MAAMKRLGEGRIPFVDAGDMARGPFDSMSPWLSVGRTEWDGPFLAEPRVKVERLRHTINWTWVTEYPWLSDVTP